MPYSKSGMVDQGFTEFYMEVMPLETSLHSYFLIPFSNNCWE